MQHSEPIENNRKTTTKHCEPVYHRKTIMNTLNQYLIEKKKPVNHGKTIMNTLNQYLTEKKLTCKSWGNNNEHSEPISN